MMRRARGLMYDVQVFDNHFRASRDIKVTVECRTVDEESQRVNV